MTDFDLVRRAERGDHAAFETLYARYQPLAYAIAKRVTGSHEDAEDACVEVWQWLVEGRWRVTPDEMAAAGGAHKFVVTLARFAALSVTRQGGIARNTENDGEPVLLELRAKSRDPEQKLLAKEFWRAWDRAFAQLPAVRRRAATLRYVEELSLRDVGLRTGVVPTTAGRYLREFREHVRAELAGYIDLPATTHRVRHIPIGAPRPSPRGCTVHPPRDDSPSPRTSAGNGSPNLQALTASEV